MNINEYFKKVYTISFRLTGEELIASDMAVLAIERTSQKINASDKVSSNILFHTAKEVCKIFLSKNELCSCETNKLIYIKEQNNLAKEPMQNVLLTLDPLNRATIVWRDILGYKIDDLALAVDCTKQELYCELNNARMQIKMHLINIV
ncbi:MAG: hypothetical protein ACERLG_09580 [Sedimentibacter sp.]